MNLGIVGLVMMVVVLVCIISNKVSPVVAMILIPVLACVICGQGGELGGYVTAGVKGVAATACMFGFSVLFFGLMTDAGVFEPVVKVILRTVGGDPVKIVIGTAILATILHLDGSGITTFAVVVPAMLPLYDKLKMSRMTLALATALAAGTMNLLPWGGPTTRAISALGSSVEEIYLPVVPAQIAGLMTVYLICYFLGRQERKNIKWSRDAAVLREAAEAAQEADPLHRPKLIPVNYILILTIIILMFASVLSTHLAFMLGSCAALMINYPDIREQGRRINAHAEACMLMISIIFASGVLSGILTNSGMADGITQILVGIIPHSLGRFIPVIFGVLGAPIQQLIPTDAYYYGVLPLQADVVGEYGIDGAVMARDAIMGHSTTGFPFTPTAGASVYLVGLCGLSWGKWQRKGIPIAMLVSAVMLLVLLITGAITV